jgi:hypothetical protein
MKVAPSDASVADAGPEAADAACTRVDPSGAAPLDASCPASDASCAPHAVPGFTPRQWIPPRAPRASCTAAQITAFYDACLGPAQSASSCNDFGSGAMTCVACLTSDVTDGEYGPVIIGPTRFDVNTPGCIALVEPCNQPCAAAIQAGFECRSVSCAGCALGEDPEGLCDHAAAQCACPLYAAQALDCANNLLANGGPAGPCLQAPTLEDAYQTIAAIFCGGR